MSKKINLYREVIKYADNDTKILPKLLESLDKLSFDVYKCSILNFCTIGSATWYGWI